MNAELQIRNTIQNYLDGYLNAEKEIVAKAFHSDTVLLSVNDQQLTKLDMPTWSRNMDERKQKGDIRRPNVEVKSIDIAHKSAVAKLELTFEKVRYTDYLSLLELADGWKVVGKIYYMEGLSLS